MSSLLPKWFTSVVCADDSGIGGKHVSCNKHRKDHKNCCDKSKRILEVGFQNTLFVNPLSIQHHLSKHVPDGSITFPYLTIQSAINAVPIATSFAQSNQSITIYIAPGYYDEDLTVQSQQHLILVGLGPVGLGTFTGLGSSPVAPFRNITWNFATPAGLNNQQADICTVLSASERQEISALHNQFRISGTLFLNSFGTAVPSFAWEGRIDGANTTTQVVSLTANTGTFQVGENVTGAGITGSVKAIFLSSASLSQLYLTNVSGAFTSGAIVGVTSGASGTFRDTIGVAIDGTNTVATANIALLPRNSHIDGAIYGPIGTRIATASRRVNYSGPCFVQSVDRALECAFNNSIIVTTTLPINNTNANNGIGGPRGLYSCCFYNPFNPITNVFTPNAPFVWSGPPDSLILDSSSNDNFVKNGALLINGATKVLLNIANVATIVVSSSTAISTTSSSAGEVTQDVILVNSAAGPTIITLPNALNRNDLHYRIKKIDATPNSVAVTPAPGQTIDGLATYPLTIQYAFVDIVSNGGNWYLI